MQWEAYRVSGSWFYNKRKYLKFEVLFQDFVRRVQETVNAVGRKRVHYVLQKQHAVQNTKVSPNFLARKFSVNKLSGEIFGRLDRNSLETAFSFPYIYTHIQIQTDKIQNIDRIETIIQTDKYIYIHIICIYIYIYIYIQIYIYIYMYVYINLYFYIFLYINFGEISVQTCICICIYVYMNIV